MNRNETRSDEWESDLLQNACVCVLEKWITVLFSVWCLASSTTAVLFLTWYFVLVSTIQPILETTQCVLCVIWILTGEVVHEACLRCYDPFSTSLAENGDVTKRLLTQSGQPATEPLRQMERFFIRQPVIITQNHLERGREESELHCIEILSGFHSGMRLLFNFM